MFFPSNNWFVVRRNCVGIWQVEAQQGSFYVPCPTRYRAIQVQDYMMMWLRDFAFYRLDAIRYYATRLIDGYLSFDEFYEQVKLVHWADREELPDDIPEVYR